MNENVFAALSSHQNSADKRTKAAGEKPMTHECDYKQNSYLCDNQNFGPILSSLSL